MSYYKYFRLNDNLIDNLERQAIYAPNREQLNDPFDANSYVKIDGRKTGYKQLIKAIKEKYPESFKDGIESNDKLHLFLKENEEFNLSSIVK